MEEKFKGVIMFYKLKILLLSLLLLPGIAHPSQHDYNIENATGASTRSDINNVLGAIQTINSGATAPSTTAAYQLWAETDSDTLWQRNAANSAWISKGVLSGVNWSLLPLTGGTLTGALLLPVGSVTNTSLGWVGDVNTGLYRVGADSFGNVAGGVEYLRISSAGGDFLGTGAVKVPVGTTAQRPGSPSQGQIRRNTTTGKWEGYSSSWGDLYLEDPSISTKTADYTTTDTDRILYLDGSAGGVDITLHTPTFNQTLKLIRTDDTLAQALDIIGTIRGEADWNLATKNEMLEIQYSTSLATWNVISHSSHYRAESTIGTVSGSTSNPTKGTVIRDRVIIVRNGRYAELTYQYDQSTAGAAGSGSYYFSLPSGVNAVTGTTISGTSDFPYATTITFDSSTAARSFPATGEVHDGTSPSHVTSGRFRSTGTFYITCHNTSGRIDLGSALAANFADTTFGFGFTIRIEVVGWKD